MAPLSPFPSAGLSSISPPKVFPLMVKHPALFPTCHSLFWPRVVQSYPPSLRFPRVGPSSGRSAKYAFFQHFRCFGACQAFLVHGPARTTHLHNAATMQRRCPLFSCTCTPLSTCRFPKARQARGREVLDAFQDGALIEDAVERRLHFASKGQISTTLKSEESDSEESDLASDI